MSTHKRTRSLVKDIFVYDGIEYKRFNELPLSKKHARIISQNLRAKNYNARVRIYGRKWYIFVIFSEWRRAMSERAALMNVTVKEKYKAGTDPVKLLIEQDEKVMDEAVKEGFKEISKNKEVIKDIEEAEKVKRDSRDKYYDKKLDRYSLERNRLHEELIERVDNLNAYPKKSEKPKVIFMGGIVGSGKSTALSKLIKRKRDVTQDYKAYPDFIYLSADTFKGWLPEYVGTNATYVHEESTDIYDKAIIKYRKQKKQIILDATFKNTRLAYEKMKLFKKAGYKVIFLGTNIKGEIAIQRAVSRFKKTGRYVSPEIIKNTAEKVNESVLTLRHAADDYAIYDTSVSTTKPLRLIESDRSLEQDRRQDAKKIVNTEEAWRKSGVDKVDLKGYDTKVHKKIKLKNIK